MGKAFGIEIPSFFPKSIFEKYLKQTEDDFEFKCRNGEIHFSALPLLRSDYFRAAVEEKYKNGKNEKIIFNFEKFNFETVKIFGDLLHDIQRTDITLIQLIELVGFLLEDNKYSKYSNRLD